jgi:hypothetical protein
VRVSASTVKKISLIPATTMAVLVIWFTVYIPEFQKLPSNYQIYMEQEGQDQIANGVGSELSQPFKLRIINSKSNWN